MSSIVNRLKPAVKPLMNSDFEKEQLLNRAVRANILQSVDQLRLGSKILADQIDNEGLEIIGAQYSLNRSKNYFLLSPSRWVS